MRGRIHCRPAHLRKVSLEVQPSQVKYFNNRFSTTLSQEDLANMTRRCAEVEKQNSLLHQQMDEMASRSREAQQQQQLLDVSFSEEGKTTEQILEILR